MTRKKGREGYAFNPDNNPLLDYISSEKWNNVDYFLFGHFHTPVKYRLPDKNADLVILGEWLRHPKYAVMENGEIELHEIEK